MRMEEDNTREKRLDALQIKRLEEAVATLKEKNAELQRDLEDRDVYNEVKGIAF